LDFFFTRQLSFVTSCHYSATCMGGQLSRLC